MATDPVLRPADRGTLPDAPAARFQRLARVRALHSSRRKRRFVVVVTLAVTLTAVAGAGFTTVRGTSPEHSERPRAEPSAAVPHQAEVTPTAVPPQAEVTPPAVPHQAEVTPAVIDPAPVTVSPLPTIAETVAPRAERPAATRPAQRRAAAGPRPKRQSVKATPERRETTTRVPAEPKAPDADPAAVIDWLLQASRTGKP